MKAPQRPTIPVELWRGGGRRHWLRFELSWSNSSDKIASHVKTTVLTLRFILCYERIVGFCGSSIAFSLAECGLLSLHACQCLCKQDVRQKLLLLNESVTHCLALLLTPHSLPCSSLHYGVWAHKDPLQHSQWSVSHVSVCQKRPVNLTS